MINKLVEVIDEDPESENDSIMHVICVCVTKLLVCTCDPHVSY